MGTLFSAQACQETKSQHKQVQFDKQTGARRRSAAGAHLLELRRDRFGVRHFLLWDLLGVFAHDLIHAPVQTGDGHLYLGSYLFTWEQKFNLK